MGFFFSLMQNMMGEHFSAKCKYPEYIKIELQ